eukprot:3162422-Amphidinium_carterae.1
MTESLVSSTVRKSLSWDEAWACSCSQTAHSSWPRLSPRPAEVQPVLTMDHTLTLQFQQLKLYDQHSKHNGSDVNLDFGVCGSVGHMETFTQKKHTRKNQIWEWGAASLLQSKVGAEVANLAFEDC